MNERLRKEIERRTGKSTESLRTSTISQHRKEAERKLGHSVSFRREFPFIGRGNVNGDKTVSHERVEKDLNKAIS